MEAPIHPKVVVSILNWNGVQLTIPCIKAILQDNYPNVHVVVLDNGSTENEATIIDEHFNYDNVYVHRSDTNLGFAGGHNYIINHLIPKDYDYCLLLNQDAIVEADCIKYLVQYMEENPDVAVSGPTVLEEDGRTIQSIGADINLKNGKVISRYQGEAIEETPYMEPHQVDCIIGNCFLMRKDAIEKVGILDEEFFAYYEEADWCTRATQSGYTCAVVPIAQVRHSKSGGFRPYYIARNMVWFMQKHTSGRSLVSFALRYWFWFIPERLKKGSHPVQLLRGAWHGWMGKNRGRSA